MSHNKKNESGYRKKSDAGYTLIEVIIAIGMCGFGLGCELGLYGMGLKINIGSETILNQSLEINSILDSIINQCNDKEKSSSEALEIKIKNILVDYPDYALIGIKKDGNSNLYTLEIRQNNKEKKGKYFFLKVHWSTG